jgi:hypothetical protein
MLPVLGAVFLCAQSLSAFAADSTSSANTNNSTQQIREQVEAKRDQISGAATLSAPVQTGASTLLDAPVETDDAPAQAQRP